MMEFERTGGQEPFDPAPDRLRGSPPAKFQANPSDLDFAKQGGLLPVVVQDAAGGEVLMLGFMNEEALEATLRTGEVVFWSRSRQRLWRKGERSGHRLLLRELRVDCDRDALLARAELAGPGVCHEGYRSCFFRRLEPDGRMVTDAARVFDPAEAYREEKRP